MLPKGYMVNEDDGLASSQTSALKKCLPNFAVAVRQPMFLPLVACVFVVFLQRHWSWGLLLAWRITFQDCIAERPTPCGSTGRHFPQILTRTTRIFNRKTMARRMQIRAGHENKMKNISKTKGGHRASFASYCLEKVNHKKQRAIRQENVNGKMKRNYRETKECGREYKGNSWAEKKERR